MNAAAEIALLALSTAAWLGVFALLTRLTRRTPLHLRIDWFKVAGYALIGLWGAAAVAAEPMRLQLSAAAGPVTSALLYAFFGFLAAGGYLMLKSGVGLRSLWAHHGVFALLTLAAVLGGFRFEVLGWMFVTQIVGVLHALARIAKESDCTPRQTYVALRLEWWGLVLVRGVAVSALTLLFVRGEVAHPSFAGPVWMFALVLMTAAMVVFPIYWIAPLAAASLRRRAAAGRRLRRCAA